MSSTGGTWLQGGAARDNVCAVAGVAVRVKEQPRHGQPPSHSIGCCPSRMTTLPDRVADMCATATAVVLNLRPPPHARSRPGPSSRRPCSRVSVSCCLFRRALFRGSESPPPPERTAGVFQCHPKHWLGALAVRPPPMDMLSALHCRQPDYRRSYLSPYCSGALTWDRSAPQLERAPPRRGLVCYACPAANTKQRVGK